MNRWYVVERFNDKIRVFATLFELQDGFFVFRSEDGINVAAYPQATIIGVEATSRVDSKLSGYPENLTVQAGVNTSENLSCMNAAAVDQVLRGSGTSSLKQ